MADKVRVWAVFSRKGVVGIGEGGVIQEQLEVLADKRQGGLFLGHRKEVDVGISRA